MADSPADPPDGAELFFVGRDGLLEAHDRTAAEAAADDEVWKRNSELVDEAAERGESVAEALERRNKEIDDEIERAEDEAIGEGVSDDEMVARIEAIEAQHRGPALSVSGGQKGEPTITPDGRLGTRYVTGARQAELEHWHAQQARARSSSAPVAHARALRLRRIRRRVRRAGARRAAGPRAGADPPGEGPEPPAARRALQRIARALAALLEEGGDEICSVPGSPGISSFSAARPWCGRGRAARASHAERDPRSQAVRGSRLASTGAMAPAWCSSTTASSCAP